MIDGWIVFCRNKIFDISEDYIYYGYKNSLIIYLLAG